MPWIEVLALGFELVVVSAIERLAGLHNGVFDSEVIHFVA